MKQTQSNINPGIDSKTLEDIQTLKQTIREIKAKLDKFIVEYSVWSVSELRNRSGK
jgi:hypothetical protein